MPSSLAMGRREVMVPAFCGGWRRGPNRDLSPAGFVMITRRPLLAWGKEVTAFKQ